MDSSTSGWLGKQFLSIAPVYASWEDSYCAWRINNDSNTRGRRARDPFRFYKATVPKEYLWRRLMSNAPHSIHRTHNCANNTVAAEPPTHRDEIAATNLTNDLRLGCGCSVTRTLE